MSVRLWKVLLPALGLSLLWTACRKDQSATVESNNDSEPNAKYSGVAFDDPAKLAKLPVVMSSQFYDQMQSARKRTPTSPTNPPSDTTTITPPPPTTVIPPATLPASYILTAPTPGNQGSEGSCVAWAAASARSIEQYYRTNATSYSYATNIFSPEFIFNQIQVGGCGSSSMYDALGVIANKGVCTWQTMPYSSSNGCSLLPVTSQYAEAANYKIPSYSIVYGTDTTAIKSSIAAKHPLASIVVIDNNFYNAGPGFIWSTKGTGVIGHALTIVGYDDSKHAFKAMNSWGTTWGDGGFIWIDYAFLSTVAYELFVMN
jgi:C1A family cysteine protease